MRTEEAEKYKTLEPSAEIQLHYILLPQNDPTCPAEVEITRPCTAGGASEGTGLRYLSQWGC